MYFQDLQKFLDEAKDSVIYISLGSSVRSDHMSEEKRRVFIEAFSALPQKILWKWESAHLPGQPANVKIGTWLPQQDILGIMTLHMIDYIHN
jgi:glucuronosyltransferase